MRKRKGYEILLNGKKDFIPQLIHKFEAIPVKISEGLVWLDKIILWCIKKKR